MPLLKAGAFGRTLFANQHPQVKAGAFGRTLFTSTVGRGSIYGFVHTTGVSGFLGSELDLAELFEITLQDGTVGRFTSCPQNIDYGGVTWTALPIKRGAIKFHADLQVDKVQLDIGLVGVTIGARAFTLPQVVRRGLLRHARVRIYAIDHQKLDRLYLRFDGYVTDAIGYSRGALSLKVGSLLDRLQEKFPKVIYSEFCNHRLFDRHCGLNKTTWKTTDATLAGTTAGRLYAAAFAYSAHPSGYWARGEVKITEAGSLNVGASRTVLLHGDGFVDLLLPFLDAVGEGEAFEAWPGCDKSGATCAETFGNYANFLGFEYIPKPEILYG
jgi:uncharacterized phage protein (TIGR02218 family)